MKIRIGINGRFLVARKTGVQRVAYNLIKSIVQFDRQNEYFIFTGQEYTTDFGLSQSNVHFILSPIHSGNLIKNYYWEQIELPRLAKKYEVQILHNPANIGPLFYKGASIINIHDLCFLVNPSWYSFSFQTLYKMIIPQISRNANKVITNSNNSKNDILRYLGCPIEKVALIYWAVEELFTGHQNYLDPTFEYKDYILYVGSVEPRKNIKRLLSAYEKLRRDHREIKTKLIIIGCSNPVFRDEQFQIRGFASDILFKGYVSDLELVNYYYHAMVCIYPSLYEGFGLPPLEAMACKTPVITSNRASLPEVVGDAAITIDPNNIEDMSESLYRVLTNEALRDRLIAMGLERVAEFSWKKAGKATLRVYEQVCRASLSSI